MFNKGFPNCCGARVLGDFGWTSTSMGTHGAVSKDRIQKWLQEELEYHNGYMAFVVIILNKNQFKHLGNIFLEEGFEVVKTGKNAGHPRSSPLYLLVKVTNAAD